MTSTDLFSYWRQSYSGGGGPATRAVSQRLGACLAWVAGRLGLSPNHLTLLSLLTSLGAALVFATGAHAPVATLACLLLYQLAYGFDCADGQLARATGRTSEFGAWLDIAVDSVSVVALSFAVLHWLVDAHGMASGAFLVVGALTAGRVLSLHASQSVGASAHARAHRPFSLAETPKRAVWLLFDTPVFLAAVCLLRDVPRLLVAYAAVMAVVYIAQSIYLGLRFRT